MIEEKQKRWLSKSQINIFRQCPYKWKLIYIDEVVPIPSTEQDRGSKIHKKVENFYKNIEITQEDGTPKIKPKSEVVEDKDLQNFIELEQQRIKSCVNERGEFDINYFTPVFQELELSNPGLMLRGIIDAVYIHPLDNKAIIIDWKTGRFNKKLLNEYRFELAIYKELFERDKRIDIEVGYWGIFFTDANKLFFEKVEQKYVNRMFWLVEKVRRKIEEGNYIPKPNFYCRWCQFIDKCNGGKYVIQ